jgi:hypothetical protein
MIWVSSQIPLECTVRKGKITKIDKMRKEWTPPSTGKFLNVFPFYLRLRQAYWSIKILHRLISVLTI